MKDLFQNNTDMLIIFKLVRTPGDKKRWRWKTINNFRKIISPLICMKSFMEIRINKISM